MVNARKVKFRCPFCDTEHKTMLYIDRMGDPILDKSRCPECRAMFLYDYDKAREINIYLNRSVVKPIEDLEKVNGRYPVAQLFVDKDGNDL